MKSLTDMSRTSSFKEPPASCIAIARENVQSATLFLILFVVILFSWFRDKSKAQSMCSAKAILSL